jgi:hypothetical protein
MHNDRVQPDVVHQEDVADEAHFQVFFVHGMAAVFNHDGLVGKPLDVREGLQENLCLFNVLLHHFLFPVLQ